LKLGICQFDPAAAVRVTGILATLSRVVGED
jgi:hypothetical protein